MAQARCIAAKAGRSSPIRVKCGGLASPAMSAAPSHSGHKADPERPPVGATSGLSHRSKQRRYSMALRASTTLCRTLKILRKSHRDGWLKSSHEPVVGFIIPITRILHLSQSGTSTCQIMYRMVNVTSCLDSSHSRYRQIIGTKGHGQKESAQTTGLEQRS